jgi:hypothetical protein
MGYIDDTLANTRLYYDTVSLPEAGAAIFAAGRPVLIAAG